MSDYLGDRDGNTNGLWIVKQLNRHESVIELSKDFYSINKYKTVLLYKYWCIGSRNYTYTYTYISKYIYMVFEFYRELYTNHIGYYIIVRLIILSDS